MMESKAISHHNWSNNIRDAIEKILLSDLVATSMMTAFSFTISEKERQQFREPELLNLLAQRLLGMKPNRPQGAAGWMAHYAIGACFTSMYHLLWKNGRGSSPKSGLILGAISGVLGIQVWKTMFRNHPCPPSIDRPKYYTQLFIAHLIFGVGAA